MINIIILPIISLFLGMNMGASGFSVSFTPSYGSGILTRKKASLLYTIFILIGGILIGPRVINTLTTKISLTSYGEYSGLIIIISSVLMMFVCNLLKIPQSTSFVTVSAFTGAAFYYHQVNWGVIIKIFSISVIFCILAFFITYFIKKIFYPPRNSNFRLYEKSIYHNDKLNKFIVWTNCYSAFAIGSNNIANVVAPVLLSVSVKPILYILSIGVFFGMGSLIFGKGVINTISKEIIPIGKISAGIISLVTSTFVIIASSLGLPTPYVQFTTFSVLAVSSVKDGFYLTYKKAVVKKIFFVWILIPVLTFLLSYLLHFLFQKGQPR
ncbi:MAG: inorganic phosphate transporter [Candidatus Omnitrophica bacterium]|nr:inorganic phosphate transporter [Candidatus Omnitrophota bacterium]MCM8802617.1 inorganic phosphate transporter [Candidatus Omnitrophota bacterium]